MPVKNEEKKDLLQMTSAELIDAIKNKKFIRNIFAHSRLNYKNNGTRMLRITDLNGFLFVLWIVGSLCCGMARWSYFNLVALDIDCEMARGFKRIFLMTGLWFYYVFGKLVFFVVYNVCDLYYGMGHGLCRIKRIFYGRNKRVLDCMFERMFY